MLLNAYRATKKMESNVGMRGSVALNKVASLFGYPPNKNAVGFGKLISMIEDNPGLVEVMFKWVGDQRKPEWAEALADTIKDPA